MLIFDLPVTKLGAGPKREKLILDIRELEGKSAVGKVVIIAYSVRRFEGGGLWQGMTYYML
jgi:hypothetical protein